jgi:hypothetical protein
MARARRKYRDLVGLEVGDRVRLPVNDKAESGTYEAEIIRPPMVSKRFSKVAVEARREDGSVITLAGLPTRSIEVV